jgi:alpha-ketoglutarate-dependent taurine dioxygenase
MFELPACARLMEGVRRQLDEGIGLAVVDRFPVERYSAEEGRAIGWLLACLVGRLVDQKWGGTRLYDVRDEGKPLGYGIRRSVTNLGQPFHTDGPWLWRPPTHVGLFCLESASEGGVSRFASLVTAHERMRREAPALLPRLYRPFWWDRQAEHPPGDARAASHPVFEYDGRSLRARYYDDYVVNGHGLAGERLDGEGRAALDALRAIVDEPANWVEFRIERGQLQYLNNARFAHCRTAFVDDPGPGRRRHLLRLWNRDEGTPHLEGRLPD